MTHTPTPQQPEPPATGQEPAASTSCPTDAQAAAGSTPAALWSAWRTAARVLTFKATREEFESLTWRHMAFGMLCTWVVGMGRWWDDPDAGELQKTGLGSVAYVVVLAAVLWVFARPVVARKMSYFKLLTFITLTAPPAILYAIPVEMFLGNETALHLNLIFLSIVAAWRVALYWRYLRVAMGLTRFAAYCALSGPISIVLLILAYMSLTRLMMRTMGGLRPVQTTPEGSLIPVYVPPPPPTPMEELMGLTLSVGLLLAGLSFLLWLGYVLHWMLFYEGPGQDQPRS